ncbi:carboxypeptidase regulatory-like domain-containing protein, partial [Herbaspirillum sp.]|uniref:carboxypeptidase regulatory-like domain-containing protein n=1 Tax=Herbaspirillum sp. TaxID=1890675 RepID=UPI002587402F
SVVYNITVTGPSGLAGTQVAVRVAGSPAPLPEYSFGKTYEDLVPDDASIEEYDSGRFSVITGQAEDSDGSPLADVSVTVLGHPEYGTVLTDSEGRFSIPAEGGSVMTVVYRKQGLLTSHRQVYVPWNDIAVVKNIVMISEDTGSTTVVFDGNPDTVVTHSSSETDDEFGKRSCTMVFTGDNRAFMTDGNGNDIAE